MSNLHILCFALSFEIYFSFLFKSESKGQEIQEREQESADSTERGASDLQQTLANNHNLLIALGARGPPPFAMQVIYFFSFPYTTIYILQYQLW